MLHRRLHLATGIPGHQDALGAASSHAVVALDRRGRISPGEPRAHSAGAAGDRRRRGVRGAPRRPRRPARIADRGAIGYLVGRAIGPAGLTRWMSRRSYRSARQLGRTSVSSACRPAARVGCERRIGTSAVRCGPRSVRGLHGWDSHRLDAGRRRAQRSRRAASPPLLHPSMANGAITVGGRAAPHRRCRWPSNVPADSSVRAIGLASARPGGVWLMQAARPRFGSRLTTCTRAWGPTGGTIRIAWRQSSASWTQTSSPCRNSPIRPASHSRRAARRAHDLGSL